MKTNRYLITILFICALLLASCNSALRVGELKTESRSVDLGDAKSVSVKINFGAGYLDLAGGAKKLLEGDFKYNVDELKPEVEYADSTLIVQQPDVKGMPLLQNITNFENEWNVRLADKVPMNLSVDLGGGTSDLELSGLSLTGLDVNLGAGISTIDLSGELQHDLNVAITTGAADLTVRLPKEVGVRVTVDQGPHTIETTGLTLNGDAYTNAAYGVSDVTLRVDVDPGIGMIDLEVAR